MKLLFLIVAIVVASPLRAHGQAANAEADALFSQGRALMDQGKYGEACSAFEASQKLDPAPTTLLNIAGCREKNHQLASAWALFLDAVRQTKDPASQRLHQVAVDHSSKLEPRLSKLTIHVAQPVANQVVTRAGVIVDPAVWDRSLPVDGGSYTIQVTAPDYETWTTNVTLAEEHDTKVVDVPPLKAQPKQAPHAGTQQTVPRDLIPPTVEPLDHGRTKRRMGLVLTGVGAVSIVAGTLFGISAISKWHSATNLCGANLDCTNDKDLASARSSADVATSRGNLSSIFIGAGVAAAGVGVVLYLVGRPDESERKVTIIPHIDHMLGLTVDARF